MLTSLSLSLSHQIHLFGPLDLTQRLLPELRKNQVCRTHAPLSRFVHLVIGRGGCVVCDMERPTAIPPPSSKHMRHAIIHPSIHPSIRPSIHPSPSTSTSLRTHRHSPTQLSHPPTHPCIHPGPHREPLVHHLQSRARHGRGLRGQQARYARTHARTHTQPPDPKREIAAAAAMHAAAIWTSSAPPRPAQRTHD